MGYDLHITRKAEWFDDQPKISLEEWETYASGDPLLSVEGLVGWKVGDKVVKAKDFAFHDPKREKHTIAASMCWEPSGNIIAKNPCQIGIAYMVLIAGRLNARVQGDEGELYDINGLQI